MRLLATFALSLAAFSVPMLGLSQTTQEAPQAPQAGVNGVGVPSCIYCPIPQYTDEARKANFRGPVTLQATINTNGRASNISVVKHAGFGLDDKAVDALKSWRFRPAKGADGQPIAVQVPIQITFRVY
jgi:periplasmic protein TonB